MEFGQPSRDVQDAALESVASDARSFADAVVRLEGWITLNHENVAIYPDSEVMRNSHSSEGVDDAICRSLWLELDDLADGRSGMISIWEELEEDNRSFEGPGVVEGVVDPACTGHLGLWPAGLNPVRRLVLGTATEGWPDFDWRRWKAERLAETARTRLAAIRRLRTTARAVLTRRLNVVDATRDIIELLQNGGEEWNAADLMLLDAIAGSAVDVPQRCARPLWSADALSRADAEVARIEARHGDSLRALSRRLLASTRS